MAIVVNLDVMMAKRKMSLSQLSEKVDITLANLSILKTTRPKRCVFPPWRPFVPLWTASPEISWNMYRTRNPRRKTPCAPGSALYHGTAPNHPHLTYN